MDDQENPVGVDDVDDLNGDDSSDSSFHDASSGDAGDSNDASSDEEVIEEIPLGYNLNVSAEGNLPQIGDHAYLGAMEEVRGRVFLEEDSIVEIPVITQRGLICVPGQTLPLFVSHPHTVSMLRRVVEGNRTFGIVPFRAITTEPQKSIIGTTAEIYEYGEQTEGNPDEPDVGFRVKARIRQRFKVIQVRRQLDGNMVARVKILPETLLQDSLYECRSHSLDKHRLMTPTVLEKDVVDHFQSQKRLYDRQYKVPYSIWPSWVHRSYDLQLVTQRVGQELKQSIFLNVGSAPKTIRIPSDPVELSYWVVQNLPLDEEQRLELLRINNPNQRLRAELSFLQRCEHLCCRECDHAVARQSDVFAMSEEGPQGAYVNPFGHVHETLTVHRAEGLRATTQPTYEFSWFPGYAWSIVECSFCQNHMGWLFTTGDGNLRPAKFWGLCRGSLKPRLKEAQTGDEGVFTMVM